MRIKALSTIILALFGLLFLGLFYVQIIRGSYYLRQSISNRIRLEPVEAPRGKIFDRNGILLVEDRMSFDVGIIPQELRNKDESFALLSSMLGISAEQIQSFFNQNQTAPFVPAIVGIDIGKENAIRLEEMRFKLPGVVLQPKPLRNYIYKNVGSHILGYVNRINREELTRLRNYGYEKQDLLGRSGLERLYDGYLRGEEGGMQIEVDNRGRQLRLLGIKEPIGGKNLYLTIDIELQKFIDTLLGSYRGVAIVIDPYDGRILALTSKPDFDPNLFVGKVDSVAVRKLLNRSDYPLVNRAISGRYPPGSIFKVVTATAALEKNKISAQTPFTCPGSYSLGKSIFNCWKKEGHGIQNLTEGIKNSCNVYFYQVGRAAGVDNIVDYAHRFGYGAPSSIDLPAEKIGLVPNKVWKMINKREIWYEGDTVNYAIGQGYLLVTPIQVLRMMAAIANGGNLVQPYLVRKIGDVDMSGSKSKGSRISQETINLIKTGLKRVVNDEDGTGRKARVAGLSIAGKTGTAETGKDRTHAWFSGFSPIDKPKVCVLVFLEYGGKGGLNASEIAGKIFEELQRKGYL